MAGGTIIFNNVTWTTSGAFYVDMPFTFPDIFERSGNSIYYCMFIYINGNLYNGYIDTYSTYLRFGIYQSSWGSNTYTVNIYFPGCVMKYV